MSLDAAREQPGATPAGDAVASAAGVARGRLADSVCQRIADEIALGHFAPGAKLDEVSLAKRFEVSRTPVREALKQLAIMGLVDCRPNRGSVVTAFSTEQIDQMFEAIGELEASCARHAALRMSADDRAQLRSVHQLGRSAMQARDFESYDAANRQLHHCIIQGSYNPVLIDLALGLRDQTGATLALALRADCKWLRICR